MRQPASTDLARLPLFGGLPESSLDAFARRAETIALQAGQEIFREGDAAKALYVIESGKLECVKHKKVGDGDVCVMQLGAGECFGEMSFVDMQPRSATVRAVEPSTIWVWPYATIHERYCSDSKCYTLLIMNIARELSRRLRRVDDLICGS
jgi:CRP-like cAMP-binding protein